MTSEVTVDYRNNLAQNDDIYKTLDATLIDAIKQAIVKLVNRGAIRSHHHDVNLYMPLSFVDEVKKLCLDALSKQDKARAGKLLSKNVVLIGGRKLHIRTSYKCVHLDELPDGRATMYLIPT